MPVFTATPVGSINNYQQAKKKPQTTQRSYSTGLPYEPAPAQSFAAPPQAPQAGQMQRPDLSSSVTTQFQQTLRGRQTPSVPPPAPVGANRLGRPQTAAPTVSTPQAGLGDYGQLGRSLAQGYQNAVASPQAAPTVRQPAAVGQSWLGGTVEGNLYGQMNQTAGQIQRPQNVGIGQVGSELEQQLLSRLGTTGEDAIAARQRADYEADAGKRRQQLVADLQRFGVLGGQGVSAGAVSDVLGEYEGQVGRGLLDIEAQAQQRRDEDLARALGFSQYQSGLGLQNQSMDQAAQLANAQLQQQNRAQNLQGLGLAADVNAQDQARQFQNIANLQQNDLTNAQLGMAQRDQNLATMAQAGQFAGQQSDLAFRQDANQRAAELANAELGMQSRGLDQNEFAQNLSQEQFLANLGLANRGLEQTANITNAQLGLQSRGLDQNALQQAANFANQQQQLGISQQAQDLADYLGFQGLNLDSQRIQNQNRQFGQDLALRQQAQDLQDYATFQGLGLEAQRVGQGQQQINNAQRLAEAQLTGALDGQQTLDAQRLAQQGQQFGQSLAEQQAARQQQNSQFYSGLNQADQQFIDQLGLQRAELFGTTGQQISAGSLGVDPNADQLTQLFQIADTFQRQAGRAPTQAEVQQLLSGGSVNTGGQETLQARLAGQDQAFRQSEANRNYALNRANLTGTIGEGANAQDTLAARQLAQQGRQFDEGMSLDRQRFGESQRQFNVGQRFANEQARQQNDQFLADLGLRQNMFGESQRQFNQGMSDAQRARQQQDRQFYADLGLRQDAFGREGQQMDRTNLRDDIASALAIGQDENLSSVQKNQLLQQLGIGGLSQFGAGQGMNTPAETAAVLDGIIGNRGLSDNLKEKAVAAVMSRSINDINAQISDLLNGSSASTTASTASPSVQPPNLPPQPASKPASSGAALNARLSGMPKDAASLRDLMTIGQLNSNELMRMYNMGLINLNTYNQVAG